MEATQDLTLGRALGRYGTRRALVDTGRALAAACLATGLVALWLAHRSAAHGDAALLRAAGAGALVLAVASAALAQALAARQVAITLHEHGVRTRRRGREQVDRFVDIEDVYRDAAGLLAWRRAAGEPWVVVDRRIAHADELCTRFVELQLALRGEYLWNRVQAGEPTSFRVLTVAAARTRAWCAASDPRVPVDTLVLDAERLAIDGKSIALEQLQRIERGVRHATLRFVDVDGRFFHALQPDAVLSLDLLLAMIEELQRERLAAAAAIAAVATLPGLASLSVAPRVPIRQAAR